MDRRQFVGAGAASATALLAGTAGASPMRLSRRPSREAPPDIEEYAARIDAGMRHIEAWSPADHGFTAGEDSEASRRLGRAAFQSLFISGMIGDLPLESQAHPAIQARIERAIPTLEIAAVEMPQFLMSRSDAVLINVQSALRDHGAGARVAEFVDAGARDAGVSAWRREQTRAYLANVEWRLRTQPARLVTHEYVDKLDRLMASDITREAREQSIAAQLAARGYWATAGESRRDRRIRRGLRTMGFGVLTFAGGAVLVVAGADSADAAVAAGLILGTVGVIMVLVGLVILLVGLATPSDPVPADSTMKRPG